MQGIVLSALPTIFIKNLCYTSKTQTSLINKGNLLTHKQSASGFRHSQETQIMSSGHCLLQSLSKPQLIPVARKTCFSDEFWSLSTTRTRGRGQEVILQRDSEPMYKTSPVCMPYLIYQFINCEIIIMILLCRR